MRTVLICHENELLDRDGLSRWLASFSDLSGIIVLRERKSRVMRRIRREIERVGLVRFFDVLAFRLYYRLLLKNRDAQCVAEELEAMKGLFPPVPLQTCILTTHSPNSEEAAQLLRELSPDIVIARCKVLLKKEVFSIPKRGTFVMHPGICPEYRNSHGCFWALARGDTNRVGTTLLQIDTGIDTGPVFGYYSYEFDEMRESHIVIQHRTLLRNLDLLRQKLLDIYNGTAQPLTLSNRQSAEWGQPWLTCYLAWKHQAQRRVRHKKKGVNDSNHAPLP